MTVAVHSELLYTTVDHDVKCDYWLRDLSPDAVTMKLFNQMQRLCAVLSNLTHRYLSHYTDE